MPIYSAQSYKIIKNLDNYNKILINITCVKIFTFKLYVNESIAYLFKNKVKNKSYSSIE